MFKIQGTISTWREPLKEDQINNVIRLQSILIPLFSPKPKSLTEI